MSTPAKQDDALIVNTGIGNLGNLSRALDHLGARGEITVDPAKIAAAKCILLPGVGAFRPPRENLRGAMQEALSEALDKGAWLLGICVGFQLLFDESEEFGSVDGLGLLPGTVRKLPEDGVSLPHIGWNPLVDCADHPLLEGLGEGTHVYFVHSFAPQDDVPDDVCLARARHGARFTAIAGRGRILGTQFHPEKSGRAGLRLLENFLKLSS